MKQNEYLSEPFFDKVENDIDYEWITVNDKTICKDCENEINHICVKDMPLVFHVPALTKYVKIVKQKLGSKNIYKRISIINFRKYSNNNPIISMKVFKMKIKAPVQFVNRYLRIMKFQKTHKIYINIIKKNLHKKTNKAKMLRILLGMEKIKVNKSTQTLNINKSKKKVVKEILISE